MTLRRVKPRGSFDNSGERFFISVIHTLIIHIVLNLHNSKFCRLKRTLRVYNSDMTEVLLVRHAKSRANVGDFVAFDNMNSPIVLEGVEQCGELNGRLIREFGIDPEQYEEPVAASEFVRPQQTAYVTGFKNIEISPLLNEPDFSRGVLTGAQIVRKHRKERWAPEEARVQARQLLDKVSGGNFPYFIAFTHGIISATVLLELESMGHDMSQHTFDDKRGYVPLQTGTVHLVL